MHWSTFSFFSCKGCLFILSNIKLLGWKTEEEADQDLLNTVIERNYDSYKFSLSVKGAFKTG